MRWEPIDVRKFRWQVCRPALLIGTSALAGVFFALPMILSGELYFRDWGNHLYLVAKQARHIESHLSPTFFLNTTERGWLYPLFAFYGATLYSVVGSAAVAMRSAWAAYVGSYALAAAGAFGGWLWLARHAGIGGWMQLLPGCVYLGGAYYVTNAYGRGAWPEFVAVSCIPMAIAGIWSNLTRHSMTAWSLAGLAVPVVFMTGSHTITFVYSVPFVAVAIAAAVLINWPAVRGFTRVAIVTCVTALAVGVNAWFLAPLLAYRDTLRVQPTDKLEWRAFDELDVIFSFVPNNPYAWSTPQLYVQAPLAPLLVSIPIILWGVLALPRARLAIAAVALHLGFFGILALITGTRIWDWLPREAHIVQFPYRLNNYLLVCICGLVTLGAGYCTKLLGSHRRSGLLARATLLCAVLFQVALGAFQIVTARTYGPAEGTIADLDRSPSTWYEPMGYANVSKRAFPAERLPLVVASADSLETTAVQVNIPPDLSADLARVDVFYSPFIAAEPDRIEGQARGHVVISVPDNPSRRSLRIEARDTPITLLGRWVTFACLLGLGLIALLVHQPRL